MRTILFVLFALLAGALASAPIHAQSTARWYRGNTHTHTWNTDGDSPPDVVATWYREHGYQFVVITDHEMITDVAPINALYSTPQRFIVISGQELTQRVADSTHFQGLRQAHLNAIGTTTAVLPIGERGIATGVRIGETYRRNAALIRAAGGVVQANHPNYRWSVPLDELMVLPDSTLIEVFNGHPTVYNDGGVDSTGAVTVSVEAHWDSLLTRGKVLFAVADDDAHSFREVDAENRDLSRPGRGWIYVRADTLSQDAIVGAIRRGDFYASTGVVLSDYQASRTSIRVVITPQADRRYRTEFIGRGGRILATSYTTTSEYRVRGDEGYVRARVVDSSGRRAWMQPVMLNAR